MKWVYVQFWDHAHGDPECAFPARTEVWGILTNEDEVALYVHSWVSDADYTNSVNEVSCILKSTIVECCELKRGEKINVQKG